MKFRIQNNLHLQSNPENIVFFAFSNVELDQKITEVFEIEGSDLNLELGAVNTIHTFGKILAKKIFILGLGDSDKISTFNLRKSFSKQIKEFKEDITIDIDYIFTNSKLTSKSIIKVISETALLTSYKYDKYISTKTDSGLELINIYTQNSDLVDELKRSIVSASATNITKELANEPANKLTPKAFVERALEYIDDLEVDSKFFTGQDLLDNNFNLVHAVGKGSNNNPFVLKLEYRGDSSSDKTFGLVGKGITYDTGGYSLKGAEFMTGMHYDMHGAATVFGTFLATVKLGLPINLVCIIGLAENKISSNAMLVNDIYKARSGKSVEIKNTDAEGRLVLHDCINYAEELGATTIIDVATLTGAKMLAVGEETAGYFTMNDSLQSKIEEAAKNEDEFVWRLPINSIHFDKIKSGVADIANLGSDKYGGASTAAAFLFEAIDTDKTELIHFDIAGLADYDLYSEGLKKTSYGALTRTLLSLLEDFVLNGK